MLENGLHAPKAASGENRGLPALGSGQRNIDGRRGKGTLAFREAVRPKHAKRSTQPGQQSPQTRCHGQYTGSAMAHLPKHLILVHSTRAPLDAARWRRMVAISLHSLASRRFDDGPFF